MDNKRLPNSGGSTRRAPHPEADETVRVVTRGGGDVVTWARRAFIGLSLICWLILLGVGLWVLSHFARALLLLIIAALLAYALAPVVAWLRRYMPRWLAILLVYVALLAVIAAFGTLIVRTAVDQITALVAQAQAFLAPGKNGAPSALAETLGRYGISQTQLDGLGKALADQAKTIGGEAVPLLTEIANATLDTFLILVVSIYLLMDGERVSHWLRLATPNRYRQRIASTLDTFQHVVGGYIRGQVTLAALIGILVGVGMFIIPATRPFGLLLGLVAFFFEFVPILGTIFSGVLCVALALPSGIGWALVVLGYFVGMHILEGDVVGPKIVGEAVGLHPVVSIIALIAGAELFGIWGALFAAPVAGVAQAIATDLYIEWKKNHPEEYATEGPAQAAADTATTAFVEGGAYRPDDHNAGT